MAGGGGREAPCELLFSSEANQSKGRGFYSGAKQLKGQGMIQFIWQNFNTFKGHWFGTQNQSQSAPVSHMFPQHWTTASREKVQRQVNAFGRLLSTLDSSRSWLWLTCQVFLEWDSEFLNARSVDKWESEGPRGWPAGGGAFMSTIQRFCASPDTLGRITSLAPLEFSSWVGWWGWGRTEILSLLR